MNIFLSVFYPYTLLTSSVGLGILWLVLLFVLCLIAVHVARLVKLGWAYSTTPQKPSSETQEKSVKEEKTAPAEPQKPSQPAQEPIYYIVERKKKRSKASYGEPKEIRFK